MNSLCATKREEKEFLVKILGNRRFVTTLLFRGSIHGWTGKDFHSRSDFKNPTVSLFKVLDGDCMGGYTNIQWQKSAGSYVPDSEAMLFNLSS